MLKADSHEDLHMYEVSLQAVLCLLHGYSHVPYAVAGDYVCWER